MRTGSSLRHLGVPLADQPARLVGPAQQQGAEVGAADRDLRPRLDAPVQPELVAVEAAVADAEPLPVAGPVAAVVDEAEGGLAGAGEGAAAEGGRRPDLEPGLVPLG